MDLLEKFIVELARFLTQTEILLESDMFRTLLTAYLYMLIMLFFAFLNIYSTDEYEFMHNEQKCWEFKHRMFFIIMKSKEKHIVSKKTFILELIGYLIFIKVNLVVPKEVGTILIQKKYYIRI